MTFDRQEYRHRALPASQRGLSLVELMIAIGLGLFLTWGAIQAFLSGKQTYSMQQAVSRIQENSRLAQEFLTFDIRNAGAYGCASDQFVPNFATVLASVSANTPETAFQNVVFAANNVTGASNGDMGLQTPLNPPPLAGTDILVVHTGTDVGVAGSGPGNYRAVIKDCLAPDMSILNPADAAPTGLSATFSIAALETAIYYIANNASGNPSLYRRMLADGATSQELLDGVENLQLELGLDTNNDGQIDSYVTPNAVTSAQWNSWSDAWTNPVQTTKNTSTKKYNNAKGIIVDDTAEQRVRAVRYSLLLRSQENLLDVPQNYTYNGVVTVAADRRLRQISGGAVGIRNRLNFN